MLRRKQNSGECILAIDAGTQAIRAVIFDLRGNTVDIEKTTIEPYYSEHPGWAEQDPDYFWKTMCNTCRRLFKRSNAYKHAVKGVALTSQRSTFLNLDRNGNPLRPAIVWLDQRRASREKWPPFYLKTALKAINYLDTIYFLLTECDANWIRQNQPEIWEKTYKYLLLSGYFTYKLTGEYNDSTANQVGIIPFDHKKQAWAGKFHIYRKIIPMNMDMLPSLVKPGQLLGYISFKAAKETGIPKGLPLIASATDKACEVLGSGCLTPDIACLSYGTTATVETTNKNYVEIIPFIPPFPSAVPGSYNTEVMIYRGYWMVSWFKKEFGLREMHIAEERNIAPEALFDELVREVPPGSMGLTLQPYWTPGVKLPGPEAKGAIIGFGDVHTRAHIYRAILEGLAYALKEGAIRTEKRNKVKIERLRVSGGGSQSSEAMQITADIFDLPAERSHTYETSALGAAIDAAVGLKLYPDFSSAVRGMTGRGEVFEPRREICKVYKELYEKVYLKIYERLKPLYKEIKDVTDYPQKR